MKEAPIPTIPLLHSVSEISHNYDAWLVDLWGVLHNGETAMETAVAACARFREEGGIVILLSNAPRPADAVRRQIEGYGVPSDNDDGIITSGDVTRAMIAANEGRSFFHLGPERDRPLFEGLDAPLVKPELADIVILTGLYDDASETASDYDNLLAGLLERELPMICANPDIKVERGSKVIYAAGAIAARYEKMGGRVAYAGKPYRPIYDLAMAKINELAGRNIAPEQILAIGDGIDTDIKGAVEAGIEARFIPSGVHLKGHAANASLSDREITRIFKDRTCFPIGAQRQLIW